MKVFYVLSAILLLTMGSSLLVVSSLFGVDTPAAVLYAREAIGLFLLSGFGLCALLYNLGKVE